MSKQKKVCSAIMRQFTEGTVKKEYLCIVDGFLECAPGFSFSVDAPIQRHETVRFMRKTGTCEKDGKPAQTRYTILDKCRRKNMMLLRACPQTGRTHQIRVHASERNVPIVGDDLYNGIEYVNYFYFDFHCSSYVLLTYILVYVVFPMLVLDVICIRHMKRSARLRRMQI